jgi:hypothetical protein
MDRLKRAVEYHRQAAAKAAAEGREGTAERMEARANDLESSDRTEAVIGLFKRAPRR